MLKSIVQTLMSGVIGGGVALAGNTFTYWNKNRELDIRMVDVALTILSAKDDGTKNEYARRYAVDLLDSYGGVKITYKDDWVKDKNGVPIGNWAIVASKPEGVKEFWIDPDPNSFDRMLKNYLEKNPLSKNPSPVTPAPQPDMTPLPQPNMIPAPLN